MVWATVSIGLTVFLAIWIVRPRPGAFAIGAPSRWLVLPDEPSSDRALVLLEANSVRATLPALAVVRPAWSAAGESWRTEKPLKPWYRSAAPYAVAALGAVSLDLTALGLGVPEIVPTHQALYDQPAQHEAASADFSGWTSLLFDTPPDAIPGMDAVASAPSDAATAFWQGSHEISHDWWA